MTADGFCRNPIRGFRNCHGNLFCQIRRDQPNLIRMHGLIQQVHEGFPAILKFRLLYPPVINHLPIDRLDCGSALPLITVLLLISSFCQLHVIVLQHNPGDLPPQRTDIRLSLIHI